MHLQFGKQGQPLEDGAPGPALHLLSLGWGQQYMNHDEVEDFNTLSFSVCIKPRIANGVHRTLNLVITFYVCPIFPGS